MSDRDRSVIASWERFQNPRDAERPEAPTKYVCVEPGCSWHGFDALEHHRGSRHHRIVLRDAPQWGPVKFGCCLELHNQDMRREPQTEELTHS